MKRAQQEADEWAKIYEMHIKVWGRQWPAGVTRFRGFDGRGYKFWCGRWSAAGRAIVVRAY
jgi:hypothetical protein